MVDAFLIRVFTLEIVEKYTAPQDTIDCDRPCQGPAEWESSSRW